MVRMGRRITSLPSENVMILLGASTVVMDKKGSAFESVYFGSSDGDPDVIAHAVEGSLAPVPWALQPNARVLLKLQNTDGSEVFGKCRREECDRFRSEISERDYEWYLRAV